METAAPVTVDETRIEERLVPLCKVLIHNDPITPIDFVVLVLLQVFRLPRHRAMAVTLEAHTGGVALVVVEPREPAEFHLEHAHSISRGRQYPLTFTIETA